MKLSTVNPTLHWNPASTEVRSTATIKTDKHSYELVIRCNKSVNGHLIGWLDKVLNHKKDMDRGRFVELTCKENREANTGFEDVFDRVASAVSGKVHEQNLKYVYLFSTTQARKELFQKLSKKIANKLEWQVYQDRNYFLIYRPALEIRQVD